jgi:hypothetical protein
LGGDGHGNSYCECSKNRLEFVGVNGRTEIGLAIGTRGHHQWRLMEIPLPKAPYFVGCRGLKLDGQGVCLRAKLQRSPSLETSSQFLLVGLIET